jgi:vesicle coat complex subunit
MEAAQSAALSRGSSTGLVSRNHSASQIKKLLESRNDREVLDGMRKVISVSLGQPNQAVT